MTTAARSTPRRGVLALAGPLRSLVLGTLLCLSPLTSLLVLGWLSRRMRRTIAGGAAPGWIMGEPGAGRSARLLGGLAENIRIGLCTALGLALWTLPFSLLWLGSWWAGWDNSFNKGYEQAAIGPTVWLAGAALAAISLTFLPFAMAHAAATRPLAGYADLAPIFRVAVAAGWRTPWLAAVSGLLSLPVLAARALPAFIDQAVPGFSEMPAGAQAEIAANLALAAAAASFVALVILRDQAARTWRRATARLATPRPAFARTRGAVCIALAIALQGALIFQILTGQFANYSPALWLTHPVYLLPWPG